MDKRLLAERFLRNECNAEEAALALKYIEENPSLLEDFTKDEQESFGDNRELPADIKTAMRSFVMRKTKKRQLFFLKYAATACLLLAVAIGYWVTKTPKGAAEEKVIAKEKATANPFFIEEANLDKRIKAVKLADGSVVQLRPGAVIKYEEGLKTNRNILLTGSAVFNVAKNVNLPFVVQSGNITTTALGTRFLVSDGNNGEINIQLYEGKVVVKCTNKLLKMRDTYLLPGNQCFANQTTGRVGVVPIGEPVKTSIVVAGKLKEKIVVEDLSLGFQRTSLRKIFNILEKKFNKPISCNVYDIDNVFFTGNFEEHDSLEKIVQVITRMNNLKYTIGNKSIRITNNLDNIIANESLVTIKTGRITDVSVSEFTLSKEKEVTAAGSPGAGIKTINDGLLRFTKTPMKHVLETFQELYDCKINFNNTDVEGMYFTGTVADNSVIKNVLETICKMNNLKVTGNKKLFLISKMK